jgi:DNA-binding MarR family transcriptional regulator
VRADISAFLYSVSTAQYDILKIKTHISAVILFKIAAQGGSIDMKDLLAASKHTPISIRLHIQYLVDSGIVDIQPSPVDRRSKIVVLTESGRRMIEDFESVVVEQLPHLNRSEGYKVAAGASR